MSFNIDVIIEEMGLAIIEAVKDDVVDIKKYAKNVFDNNKASLKELGEARVAGEVSEKVFNAEVEREKKVVATELMTIELMNKAAAQQAVNSAINVFINAGKASV